MQISVQKLKHHPRNGEIYQLSNIDDLLQSIGEVGLLQPLVVDQSNQVISGNRRLCAIKQLGWKQVDVEVISVDETEVVNLLIHHNKQRVKSCREILNEYHALEQIHGKGQGKRTDLLTSVKSNRSETTRDIIAKRLGLSSSQVQRLLYIERENPDFIDHIDRGTLTVNQSYNALKKRDSDTSRLSSGSKSMKIHNSSGFNFYNKSSHRMDELSDGSVQCIVTSPPYWSHRKYTEDTKDSLGNERTPDEYVSRLVSHLNDVKRVLSDKGSFFMVIGDKFHEMNLLNLPHRVAIGLQENGWLLRNTIVWHKTNPKPTSSKSNLQSTYEFIFHFTKGQSYLYNPTRVSSLDNRGSVGAKIGHNNLNVSQRDSSYFPYVGDGMKNMGDFWSEGVVESAVASHNHKNGDNQHPAPFPHKIVVLPILQTTNEGDLVCDPFHGSGTTGEVAQAYRRRYVGYDVNCY